jgi:hypothetical protein
VGARGLPGLTRWLERQLLAVGEELCGCLDADPLGRFSRQLDDVLIIERSPDGRLCEAPNVN